MATVTYLHQPGIQASHGNVPLSGNSHIYTVGKVLWPADVERFIESLLIGESLHLCCGLSRIGDVRLDWDEDVNPDVVGDASNPPFEDLSFDTVLADPPYNGRFQWNHDLLKNMARVARRRIVFQHWFLPADKQGRYKKDHSFTLSQVHVWQPKTYFGRVQVVSVFDRTRPTP